MRVELGFYSRNRFAARVGGSLLLRGIVGRQSLTDSIYQKDDNEDDSESDEEVKHHIEVRIDIQW